MNYYLVGIKGTGMSALACFLKDLNNDVRGCDVEKYFFTEDRLKEKNIIIDNIENLFLNKDFIYIIGNTYNDDSEIVKTLREEKIEYYYYHNFIGSKINKEIFAVSGTHGKTTTAKFLSQMLNDEVSYIIGDGSGKGTNSDYLILEACEYKDHFLSYHPKILIINNIELDHPDYFKNVKQIIESFNKLVLKSDLVLVNGDDLNSSKLKGKNIIKIGTNLNNDIVFNYTYNAKGTKLQIKYASDIYNVDLHFKGSHLVYNFVMAYVLCLIVGITPNVDNLIFPKRRMEKVIYGKTILIDDYAHHPTEIKALHEYISLTYPNYQTNVIFQPHTYTRTLKLKKYFVDSLSLFDNVYLDKVFTSSREKENLYSQLKINKYFKKFCKFDDNVLNLINKKNKEVWVFLGAGEANKYIKKIINNENI